MEVSGMEGHNVCTCWVWSAATSRAGRSWTDTILANMYVVYVQYEQLIEASHSPTWETMMRKSTQVWYKSKMYFFLWEISLLKSSYRPHSLLWVCCEVAVKLLWSCFECAVNVLWLCCEFAVTMLWQCCDYVVNSQHVATQLPIFW